MNSKITTIVGALAFAGFIIVALVAYNMMAERTEPANNIVLTQGEVEPEPAEVATPPTEEESGEEAVEAPAQQLVPNFTFADADGNLMELHDFFGKPIVLNFWATWCPSCVNESVYFDRLYAEYGEDVHVLKINLLDGQRETRQRVDEFMDTRGYGFPLYFDIDNGGGMAFGVQFIPVTFFIDAYGHPVARTQGAVNWDTLMQGLEVVS